MPVIYRPLPSKPAKQTAKQAPHQKRSFPRFPRSPRTTKIVLVFLAVVVLVNILVARFSAQMQATLTLPTLTPSPASRPMVTPTNSITLSTQNIVAQDTFARPDQSSWGSSTDGQMWSGDAASAQSFTVTNHQGQVSGGNAIFDAILGPRMTNAEIVFTGSLSQYDPSTLGALLRWTDAKNLYKAELDGKNLVLLKKVAGVVTVLKTVPLLVQGGVLYTLRFRATDSQLFVSAWPTAQQQPAAWQIVLTDTSLTSGYGGLRFFVQDGLTATITSFTESKL